LIEITYSSPNIYEGAPIDFDFLVSSLLTYGAWTPSSTWTVIASAGSIAILNLATLAEQAWLRGVVVFPWSAVLRLGMVFGILIALAGLGVLILGLTHKKGYDARTAIFYALWVACLFGLPLLARTIDRSSIRAFGSNMLPEF
jgi:NADH:ubiquinone oxidoreductase subunit 2 (subunit N)